MAQIGFALAAVFFLGFLFMWLERPRGQSVLKAELILVRDRLNKLEKESDEWKLAVQTLGNALQETRDRLRDVERRQQALDQRQASLARQVIQAQRIAALAEDVVEEKPPEAPPPVTSTQTWYDLLSREES